MARERGRPTPEVSSPPPNDPVRERPDASAGRESSSTRGFAEDEPERSRPTGTIEHLLQEFLRRAAAAGFSGLRFTEGALRRGLSDALPPEWVDYVSRQSDEVRSEMIDRFAAEFGSWLRGIDLEQVLAQVLERYRFRATIELHTEPRAREESPLQSFARRR